MVVGCGGAGKSTFSRALGDLTGLPVVHLDRLYWRPGWGEPPKAEWRARVEREAAKDRWILDGNYGGTLRERICRADAVVFLDLGPLTCTVGVLKRTFVGRFKHRPDLPEGCRDTVDWEFLKWVWQFRQHSRPRVLEAVAAAPTELLFLRLETRKAMRALLDQLDG